MRRGKTRVWIIAKYFLNILYDFFWVFARFLEATELSNLNVIWFLLNSYIFMKFSFFDWRVYTRIQQLAPVGICLESRNVFPESQSKYESISFWNLNGIQTTISIYYRSVFSTFFLDSNFWDFTPLNHNNSLFRQYKANSLKLNISFTCVNLTRRGNCKK